VGIVSWILWGLFVGFIARLLLPGRQAIGLLWTMVLGIAGSLIGGFFATEIIDIADSDEFDFGSFLIAIGTSVLLLWAYLRYFAERDRGPGLRPGD
jgi:uncharacterized membrane protein YeaQ/YmgE (transglycosylase-associated protein family)